MLLRERLAKRQNLGVILSHLFIYEPYTDLGALFFLDLFEAFATAPELGEYGFGVLWKHCPCTAPSATLSAANSVVVP